MDAERQNQPSITEFAASVRHPVTDDRTRLKFAVDSFASMCRHFSTNHDADAAHILSAFHSVAEPSIGLSDYMDRLDKNAECGEEGVLLGMIIATRFCAATKMIPSALSMHRLLLVGTRIATKAHHDVFRSNRAYARAGGLTLKEVNDLELLMLVRLEYKVVVYHTDITNLRKAFKLMAAANPTTSRNININTLARALDPQSLVLPSTIPVPDSSTPFLAQGSDPMSPGSNNSSRYSHASTTASGSGPHAIRAIRTWRRGSGQSVSSSTVRSGSVADMSASSMLSAAMEEMSVSTDVVGVLPGSVRPRPANANANVSRR